MLNKQTNNNTCNTTEQNNCLAISLWEYQFDTMQYILTMVLCSSSSKDLIMSWIMYFNTNTILTKYNEKGTGSKQKMCYHHPQEKCIHTGARECAGPHCGSSTEFSLSAITACDPVISCTHKFFFVLFVHVLSLKSKSLIKKISQIWEENINCMMSHIKTTSEMYFRIFYFVWKCIAMQ